MCWRFNTRGRSVVWAVGLVMVLSFAGCGDRGSSTSGRAVDAAFIADMTAHHEGAVDMARVALARAEHRDVRRLAREVVSTQEAQIKVMRHIGGHLGDRAARAGSRHMGTSTADMGVAANAAALEDAEPFDRAFIDAMLPHHEGAIAMAEGVLHRGEHHNLRSMARDIIDTQTEEIARMRRWREAWYGSASTTSDEAP